MRLPHALWLLMALIVVLGAASSAYAAPIASKAGRTEAAATDGAARDQVRALLASQDVARVLAAHGLTPQQVEERLARLSAEDLATLAAHPDQVQAAGNVPNYIWVLLAILMGVTIIVTVF